MNHSGESFGCIVRTEVTFILAHNPKARNQVSSIDRSWTPLQAVPDPHLDSKGVGAAGKDLAAHGKDLFSVTLRVLAVPAGARVAEAACGELSTSGAARLRGSFPPTPPQVGYCIIRLWRICNSG